jgi:hypothetical protein
MPRKSLNWALVLAFAVPFLGCNSNPGGPDASGVVKAGEDVAAKEGGKTKKNKQAYANQKSAID